jgi:AcrR family transcriptional regulator
VIQIARVDYENTPPQLRQLLIERSRGVGRIHGRVFIEPVDAEDEQGMPRRLLGARVEAGAAQDPRTVLLDAALAEHVLEAVGALLADPDPAPRAQQAGSPWTWSVVLDWGGRTTRLQVHGAPSDEALHGVLEIAARLLDEHS